MLSILCLMFLAIVAMWLYSPYFQRKYGNSFRFFVPDFQSGASGHWLANSHFSAPAAQHNNFLDKYDFEENRNR